jgi:hypothetical protein
MRAIITAADLAGLSERAGRRSRASRRSFSRADLAAARSPGCVGPPMPNWPLRLRIALSRWVLGHAGFRLKEALNSVFTQPGLEVHDVGIAEAPAGRRRAVNPWVASVDGRRPGTCRDSPSLWTAGVRTGPHTSPWTVGTDTAKELRIDEVDGLTFHEAVYVPAVCRIAAEQPVIAQDPQIAPPRDRLFERLGHGVLIRQSRGRLGRREPVQLRLIEADQIDVEVGVAELGQLAAQQLLVPPRQPRQPVVGDLCGAPHNELRVFVARSRDKILG